MEEFTEVERIKIKAAKEIIAEAKRDRRARQTAGQSEVDRVKRAAELSAARAALEKAAIYQRKKENFDRRIRTVLLEFTRLMSQQGVHILKNADEADGASLSFMPRGNSPVVFSMVDARDKEMPNASIRWVYGKGFEWV
jgi:hypothetical protein